MTMIMSGGRLRVAGATRWRSHRNRGRQHFPAAVGRPARPAAGGGSFAAPAPAAVEDGRGPAEAVSGVVWPVAGIAGIPGASPACIAATCGGGSFPLVPTKAPARPGAGPPARRRRLPGVEKLRKEALIARFNAGVAKHGLPPAEAEYRFAAMATGGIGEGLRKRLEDNRLQDWRFDFAYPKCMLAIEVDGGVWTHGRHTRGQGFIDDQRKRNAAMLLGWRVLHYTPDTIEFRQIFDAYFAKVRQPAVMKPYISTKLRQAALKAEGE